MRTILITLLMHFKDTFSLASKPRPDFVIKLTEMFTVRFDVSISIA